MKEHLLIQTNDDIFIPGESLLIAVRCLDGNNQYSHLSRVVYIELIDSDDNSVVREKLTLEKGKASGSIYMPSYLKTGIYTLVSYTRWMKNYSYKKFPKMEIRVINPFQKIPANLFSEKTSTSVNARFFPEFGQLIAGTNQKVGFWIVDQFENQFDFRAKLMNSNGDEIVEFSLTNNDIGFFEFTPTLGENYNIVLVDDFDKIHFLPFDHPVLDIPKIEIREFEDHIQMSSDVDLDGSIVEVWLRGDRYKEIPLKRSPYKIARSELPTGIFGIRTMKDGKALAINHVYNPPSRVPTKLTLSGNQFQQREKVELKVEFPPYHSGDYTILVRKNIDEGIGPNMLSSFFEDGIVDNKTGRNRKLNESRSVFKAWEDHGNFKPDPLFLPDYRGNLISGKALTNQGEPIQFLPISLSIPEEPFNLYTSRTNKSGIFNFHTGPLNYQGPYVISASEIDGRINLTIDDPFLNKHQIHSLPEIRLNKHLEKWLVTKSVEVQLENAYFSIKDTVSKIRSTNAFLRPIQSKSYLLDDYTRFPKMEDPIREYVAEIWLRQGNTGPSFSVPYSDNKSGNIDTTLSLINGMPVSPEKIISLNQGEIERIDVFQKQLKAGYWEFNGLVNFKTFDDDLDKLQLADNHKRISYQSPKPYYSLPNPDYRLVQSRIPDFRTTLFWQPHVDIESSRTFSFYTSDSPGLYEVVIVGIIDGNKYIYDQHEFSVMPE